MGENKKISTQKSTFVFVNSRGKELLGRRFLPEETVDSVVVFLHGYAEHSGRIAHVAQLLNKQGIAFFTYDYEGHGKSDGLKADIREFSYLVDDAQQFLKSVQEEYPSLPVSIWGQCIGGTVAVELLQRNSLQQSIDQLILTAPFFGFAPEIPGIVQQTASYISSMAGTFPIMSLDMETLSRDEEVIQAFNDDELTIQKRLRARMTSHMIEHGKLAYEQLFSVEIPTLLIHSTDDHFANPKPVKTLLEDQPNAYVNIVVLEDKGHLFLHEPGWKSIVNDILQWMKDPEDVSSDIPKEIRQE